MHYGIVLAKSVLDGIINFAHSLDLSGYWKGKKLPCRDPQKKKFAQP